ncbi:MAG: HtrA protease/chaperone protein [Anaerolineae bacterium]|nr:MAG: HtrA protease/chaperone protein [Anaerolineae bacterium]
MKINAKVLRPLILLASLIVFSLGCTISVPLNFSLPELIQSPEPSQSTKEVVVQSQVQPTPTPFQLPPQIQDEQALLVALYARANPAVVNITEYASQAGQVTPLGQGSGFVYDNLGHIVTNAHVIHGSDQIEVTFWDGTIELATLVGEDLHSDLAVVKVDRLPDGVVPLPLGDMENLAVGQTVVAIGNPFGLEGTLTKGVISALGRSIPALTSFSIPQAIQTDAAINPGNSGGPLLNLQGEVIGVNAQIETGGTSRTNSGVGFAIPVSILKIVIPDLIEKGEHEWAWLGVRGGSLSPLVREAMKLKVDKGAYIAEVVAGGPSAEAGLRGSTGTVTVRGREVEIGGDVVIAINGEPVRSFDDLLIYISLKGKPGDTVELTVIRDNQEITINVKLEARPTSIEP